MLQAKLNVIFNADDYGMRRVTTDSIIEMHECGIVKSTTILTNFGTDNFDYAVEEALAHPGLGIGIHLNITEGRPLTGRQFPHCKEGNFFTPAEYYDGFRNGLELDTDAVEREYTAQIEKALSAGIKLTHMDSHHHFHFKTPCESVARKLAKKYDLPMRLPRQKKTSDILSADDFFSMSKIESIEELLNQIDVCLKRGDTVVEFGCHPTKVTDDMWERGGWLEVPDRDWKILHNEQLLTSLQNRCISIINYHNLKHRENIIFE